MTAEQRMKRFINAIENEEFGKCPKAPKWYETESTLAFAISDLVECENDNVVVVEAYEMSKPEIRYCLKVCRKLGYKPKW